MKKDDKATFLIHQCVDSNILEKIIDYETTKEAWDVLATTYASDKQTKKVRLMALRCQLLELIYSSWLWFWKNQTREGESLNNRTITNLNGT